jgi:hypothetical protein
MTDIRAGQRWAKIDCEPIAAIELRAYPGDRRTLRWGLMLVWFMRFVAVLWMSHSLLNWCQILGVGSLGKADLSQLDDHAFAATVFFATLDPVAAVGLWLATPWGGVTWLVAVAAQIFAAVMRHFADGDQRRSGRLLFRPDLRRQSRALWKLTIFYHGRALSLPEVHGEYSLHFILIYRNK